MPAIHRTSRAEVDLCDVWSFVAQDSIDAADRLLRRIGQLCERLSAHPQMGQHRPELAEELRSFSVGAYVIYFRPIADGIEVVRVLHSVRDVAASF